MNRTITIDELAATVAQFTQSEQSDALTFIRETFLLASEQLLQGEAVEVAHLGTFMAVEGTLRFRPDPELAEAINAPFAAFTAMEITDPALLAEEEEREEVTEEEPEITEPAEPAEEPVAEEPATEEEEEIEAPTEPDESMAEPVAEEPAVQPAAASGGGVSQWVMPLMLAVLCLTVGFVMGRLTAPAPTPVYLAAPIAEADTTATTAASEHPDSVATAAAPAAEPKPEEAPKAEAPAAPVTDTIRPGHFLTSMAREHYGQMEYWVYIYIDNSSRLGNPDRLPAGTVVTIPPAAKYGLVKGDSAKIAEAKRMAADIYKNR